MQGELDDARPASAVRRSCAAAARAFGSGTEQCQSASNALRGRVDRFDQQFGGDFWGQAVGVQQHLRSSLRLAQVLNHPLVDSEEVAVQQPALEILGARALAQQFLERRATDALRQRGTKQDHACYLAEENYNLSKPTILRAYARFQANFKE